ncbi:hypothetical protein Taro_050911 [Colocasia esculenta]|uniref:Uncharacterized protein n=1 Tax=Colocasia esculenta TaxID=4460 RepID=A0A843XEL4_COLES|nr:hypothetical protein [Colocasia esculenta]
MASPETLLGLAGHGEKAKEEENSGVTDWDTEVSFRSSSRRSLASPFLTASLFVAPELLREARRGTVVRPDYGGYCWVTLCPTSLRRDVRVRTQLEDKTSVDAPDLD